MQPTHLRTAHFSLTMVATSLLFYFGIFGLLFANQVSSSCVTEENQRGMIETSCIRLALTNVPMKEIPQDTGILALSFNNLKAISTSTFKGMKQLVDLDLSDNAMTSFKVDLPIMLEILNLANNSFKSIPDLSQLSSLTTLVLSNNHISTIPDSAFKGLKNLKVLELQKNTISSLSDKVFDDLDLDHLDLSNNQLRELPSHLIHNLVHLKKLYLAENLLTNIPENFFDGLEVLIYVYLDNNPWNCSCALHYFKKWVEDNEANIYTLLSDGTPGSEDNSVLCSDKTPIIEYNMDACNGGGRGDVDQHIMTPKSKVTQALPTSAKTTEPVITTKKTTMVTFAKTTPVLTTEEHPTSVATTTKSRRLTTSIVTSTKYRETTPTAMPALTTRKMTTKTYKTTLMTTAEQRRTTPQTTEGPTSISSTTTLYPTSTPPTTVKVEPSTMLTTSIVSTQKHLTETLLMSTENQLLYTMPPAKNSRAEAHGMSWLEYKILKNCCFLHLIIYIFGILLLIAQMILSACLLVWTHTHLYRHYQALTEKLPNIRLIRYSLRAPVSEDTILLVHDKAIESNFSDQSFSGVTRMLVLEANTRDQERLYTSAIL
ncbi:hypothetical protein AB205_0187470 [Aquarana catesbeiana]|uniref:LRRCT domain-containing protein n=1 Tax=Aquarana catesbeiana TaxID=8400 RepID=A0A2G9S2Z0_AQUCT|nr:hypothetical protein AB205_0187470 [Aquarana catesbeiana]